MENLVELGYCDDLLDILNGGFSKDPTNSPTGCLHVWGAFRDHNPASLIRWKTVSIRGSLSTLRILLNDDFNLII